MLKAWILHLLKFSLLGLHSIGISSPIIPLSILLIHSSHVIWHTYELLSFINETHTWLLHVLISLITVHVCILTSLSSAKNPLH